MTKLGTPADLTTFEGIIAPWKSAYRCADCACLTIKVGDESPMVIGRILLYTASPAVDPSFTLNTKSISARRALITLDDGAIDPVIASAAEGTIVIGEETFALKQDGQYLGTVLFPLNHPEVSPGMRIPALRVFGVQKGSLLQARSFKAVEHLDWELKASDQPFATFDELLATLGLPPLLNMGDFTALDIAAGVPATISDSSHIKQGHANVVCRLAHGLDTAKVKFGYKVQRAGVIVRSMRKGEHFNWLNGKDYQEGSIRIDVGETPALQAFLSYEDTALHQSVILDPDKRLNARHAAYEVFDQELRIFKTYVNGQGADPARDFEKGISFLASLLGFSILPLNVVPQKLSDAPDLIVSTPAGHIAVIECTIGHLNHDNKLSKLVRRTTQLKDKLRGAGFGHLLVQPVIVSLLTKAELQADLEDAGKHRIAVITKEGLQPLVEEATLFPNPEEVFNRLARNIPGSDATQETLFPTQPS